MKTGASFLSQLCGIVFTIYFSTQPMKTSLSKHTRDNVHPIDNLLNWYIPMFKPSYTVNQIICWILHENIIRGFPSTKKELQCTCKQHYLLPIILENLICLFHGANNLHMSDLKSCLYKAAMIFLQNKFKYITDINFHNQREYAYLHSEFSLDFKIFRFTFLPYLEFNFTQSTSQRPHHQSFTHKLKYKITWQTARKFFLKQQL